MTTSATPGQAASGGATGGPGQPAPSRGTRPARLLVYGVIALVVIVAAAAAALVVDRQRNEAGPRPSGIPADI